MNGSYRFEHVGYASPGAATLVLADGTIRGMDDFGGHDRGTYGLEDGSSGKLELTMPTGGTIVTGRPMGALDVLLVRFSARAGALEGEPFRPNLDEAEVTVRLTRLQDL